MGARARAVGPLGRRLAIQVDAFIVVGELALFVALIDGWTRRARVLPWVVTLAGLVDLDAGTVSVRRSAGVVRVKGEGATVAEGDTKSGKPRVIDIDAATAAVLRAHRRERGAMALQLARDDALVFGDHEGRHLHPERFSRTFHGELARARNALGADKLPVIRLHDLRHTHATILLTAREPVHVVSQRLGHASGVITQTVYAHVPSGLPAGGRRAVRLADREGESTMSGPETSERHHGPFPAGRVPLSPARMSCPRGERTHKPMRADG